MRAPDLTIYYHILRTRMVTTEISPPKLIVHYEGGYFKDSWGR